MNQISFELVAECPHTRARAGLLHTPHGTIETPVFMPVGTQATVKGLSQRDLAGDLGVKILLANTYHLYLRPGHEIIRKMGGLHRFMSWPNALLTDADLRAAELMRSDSLYADRNRRLLSLIGSVDAFNRTPAMTTSQAYDNLNGLARELQDTVRDFRQNPRKFLQMKVF